jgi:hypothetical protein
MGYINVDYLEVGMVVASDILNSRFQLLMPAETILDQHQIDALRHWGVKEIDVKGKDRKAILAQLAAEFDPEILSAAEKALKPTFAYTGQGHPFLQELFAQCVLRKASQLRSKKDTN